MALHRWTVPTAWQQEAGREWRAGEGAGEGMGEHRSTILPIIQAFLSAMGPRASADKKGRRYEQSINETPAI